jgi:hypothetical protein
VTPTARWEYRKAIYPRYRQAGRAERHRILDEFCAITGYHRKYGIRLLNRAALPEGTPRPRRRPPLYGPPVIEALQPARKDAAARGV